jgi:hypothetical protein
MDRCGKLEAFAADGARSPQPNRVAEEVEQAILVRCQAHPFHGALRVAADLALAGIHVSSTGARGGPTATCMNGNKSRR